MQVESSSSSDEEIDRVPEEAREHDLQKLRSSYTYEDSHTDPTNDSAEPALDKETNLLPDEVQEWLDEELMKQNELEGSTNEALANFLPDEIHELLDTELAEQNEPSTTTDEVLLNPLPSDIQEILDIELMQQDEPSRITNEVLSEMLDDIVKRLDQPDNPQNFHIEAIRLGSFRKWVSTLHTPTQLAAGGFYYTGKID